MKLQFTVLDPTGDIGEEAGTLAPRPADLRGKRLGMLWNEKPNGDVLLARLQEALEDRYELSTVVWRQKTSSQRVEPETLEDLVREADCVLNALAD